jgi:hypothetical protein
MIISIAPSPQEGIGVMGRRPWKKIFYRIESRIGKSLMKPEPLALFLLPRRQYAFPR